MQYLDNNSTVLSLIPQTITTKTLMNLNMFHDKIPTICDTPYQYTSVSLHVLLKSAQEHKVTQFQMSCWTPEGLCTSPPAIMALQCQV